jgi:hypothetical protein
MENSQQTKNPEADRFICEICGEERLPEERDIDNPKICKRCGYYLKGGKAWYS